MILEEEEKKKDCRWGGKKEEHLFEGACYNTETQGRGSTSSGAGQVLIPILGWWVVAVAAAVVVFC